MLTQHMYADSVKWFQVHTSSVKWFQVRLLWRLNGFTRRLHYGIVADGGHASGPNPVYL